MGIPKSVIALLGLVLLATVVVLVTDVPIVLKIVMSLASVGFAALVLTSRRSRR